MGGHTVSNRTSVWDTGHSINHKTIHLQSEPWTEPRSSASLVHLISIVVIFCPTHSQWVPFWLWLKSPSWIWETFLMKVVKRRCSHENFWFGVIGFSAKNNLTGKFLSCSNHYTDVVPDFIWHMPFERRACCSKGSMAQWMREPALPETWIPVPDLPDLTLCNRSYLATNF